MKTAGFQGLNINCFNFLSLSCSLILHALFGPDEDDDDDNDDDDDDDDDAAAAAAADDDDEGNVMRSPNREKERNQNKILTCYNLFRHL
jgi:hypothetical protein